MKLFTKKFLDELEKKCEGTCFLDYYMDDMEMCFHDAILEIAKIYEMEPEYIKENDE